MADFLTDKPSQLNRAFLVGVQTDKMAPGEGEELLLELKELVENLRIEVTHAERQAGQSKYSLYRLIRLNFDLMTGFSVAPLQFFTMAGTALAVMSLLFVLVLAIRRLVVGPEAEGLFTLFGIAFFLIGVLLIGLGVVGEYVGRIYEQVRQRPRYTIAAVLEEEDSEATQRMHLPQSVGER